MISIIIILFICILSSMCISSISGGLYYDYSRNDKPFIIPASLYFESKPNNVYIGPEIKEYSNMSVNKCLGNCLESPHCVGVTYTSKDKTCKLQSQSFKSEEIESKDSGLSPWEGKTAYARINPRRRVDITKEKESGEYVFKSENVKSLNECIHKCVGAREECSGANYYKNGTCQFLLLDEKPLSSDLESNSDSTFFYKNGLPGLKCDKSSDCIFGYCENNTCLNRKPLPPGSACKGGGRECDSGICDKIVISYSDQIQKQEDLIEDDDPDAKSCDSYKTCGACAETVKIINKCEWRTPDSFPEYPDDACSVDGDCSSGMECKRGKCKCSKESCVNGCCIKGYCVPSSSQGTCFTRDVDKEIYRCR
jgi:PAN domain